MSFTPLARCASTFEGFSETIVGDFADKSPHRMSPAVHADGLGVPGVEEQLADLTNNTGTPDPN